MEPTEHIFLAGTPSLKAEFRGTLSAETDFRLADHPARPHPRLELRRIVVERQEVL
jgi:hypothetical protein